MKHTRLFTMVLIALLSLAVLPAAAQEESGPAPVGLRPDAPPYALHGPYWVGTQDLVLDEETENELAMTVWYPALNPDNTVVIVSYSFEPKWTPKPDIQTSILGHALRDADPDTSGAPYPLVIFSHGFSGNPFFYANLVEHLASHGFVIVAPDHPAEGLHFDGDLWKDIPTATVARPGDIVRAIDFAEGLTAGGALEGLIDMGLIAVAGHSYGGYTALAAAGARYDPVGFHHRCETDRVAGDPNVWLCDTLIPYETDMTGLASATTDLWPSWGDARVDAIIPMAGDSYMFDQRGLAEINVPVLAMGGTIDTSTPYEWGTHPTYQYVSSQQKALVAFENAEHTIFFNSCEAATWMIDAGFFGMCADAVWDQNRAHDLINHFTTAFLLDVLKGDAEAHAALLAENVSFPGITYETTMKQAN